MHVPRYDLTDFLKNEGVTDTTLTISKLIDQGVIFDKFERMFVSKAPTG